ncbi:MAG: heme exporter protein CcmB [Bacteroidia bacterium]|nr:heme exporter protein CcmB [Bacteroidia bacterium]
MIILREIGVLLRKEFMLEWKQKYAFNGLIMYVLCMVVVISLAFVNKLNPLTWNIIYWIIMLFVAINSVAKSFLSESSGQSLYLYGIASPTSIILSKLIYNLFLLGMVSIVALFSYSFLSDVRVEKMGMMILITLMGSMAMSANLTLVTAIASKAANQGTLMAVLSFPLLVPVLLVLIRLSRYAVEGFDAGLSSDSYLMLGGITVVLTIVSVILFPFVWRD